MEERIYKCYIECDGNVITRKPDGTMIPQFTGNWTILHKVMKYATADARFKAQAKSLDPDLYIGNIVYIMRNPSNGKMFEISVTFLARMLKFIIPAPKVDFSEA